MRRSVLPLTAPCAMISSCSVKKTFDYIILDESHTIRNPSSKTSQATRKLTGDHRLCLTGTPVQNTTMDLWPQFEFINPGLLGGQKRFRDRWVKPLEKNNDQTTEEMLHKMVAPFILRRTKQKVAGDLPPLTSSQVDCEMDVTQQQIYEKYRQVYYQIVNEAIDEKSVRDSRFTVLEGLTRLRQICCSPRLIEGESGASAKLSRFTELAEELIQEGHRALVFSQFVSFLYQIEAEIKSRGWEYEYLDGQTRNRQERVERFQSDPSKELFLISLKAGGEGLNLTAADYVFLMDPWWNPAAEQQAMDRTHRIGQDEHVFAYRFVCPGTVEEKMLRLQERKRNLAQKLVVAELFSYSYDNYEGHLGINPRFDVLMPENVLLLQQAEVEGWSDEQVAAKTDFKIEDIPYWRKRFREAWDIVNAKTPAHSFLQAIRASVKYAIEEGLDEEEDIDNLVGQISYRVADLSLLLKQRKEPLWKYSKELRSLADDMGHKFSFFE